MKNKPIAVIEIATPLLVERLLSYNTDNRPIRKGVIDLYASEIINNRWCLTNQGVGVSEDGILIDGQHRLLALKKCGYPAVEILIVYGLKKEARLAVDQHSKRSARDLLQFAFNAKVARSAPAIARLIDREKQGWTSGSTPIGRIIEILEDLRHEIELIVSAPSFESYFSAPVLTGAVKALVKFPDRQDQIIEFMDRVRLGEMLSRNEPAFCLRKLITSRRIGGGADQREFMDKTLKAITCHLQGNSMYALHA
jgi:hypothetical protein